MRSEEKTKIISTLSNMGYVANFQDGVLYFSDIPFSQVEDLVKKLEYRGSYGVRQKKEEVYE